MSGISDFVRSTLAYLTSCCTALLTLIVAAAKFRPIVGALRCKVRSDRSPSEVPDSRVILFAGCCIFGTVCSYSVNGLVATTTALVQAAVGAALLSKTAIVISVLFYLACEHAITQASSRAATPGRKGRRNRHILRFLVSAFLIQVAIYEPLAIIATDQIAKASWLQLPKGTNQSITDVLSLLAFNAKVLVLLVPFIYLWSVVHLSRPLKVSEANSRGLAQLPINLLFAGLVGSLLVNFIYPPQTPKLVTLHCEETIGAKSDELFVDALFRNDGDGYWTPRSILTVNLQGQTHWAPWTSEGDNHNTGNMISGPTQPGDSPLNFLVGPHQEFHFQRHVPFDSGYLNPQADTACTLYTEIPEHTFFDTFNYKEWTADRIHWVPVIPAEYKSGDVSQALPAESVEPTSSQVEGSSSQ